ncbi:MAG: cache domain-containing protein [Methanothrix sp.]|nr:cache domain-containing protein [Methanothrix sp.]
MSRSKRGQLLRNMNIFLTIWILAALSICLSVADAGNSTKLILQPEDREELRAFVDEARDFALQNGRDRALEVFNDSKGEFVRGDLYIFAYDFQGTTLAHPYRPDMVGRNNINLTDSNSVYLKKNMREIARRGEGFVYYVWPNPAQDNRDELKLSYVMRVDDGLWLAAGIYLTNETFNLSSEDRRDLVQFVENARDFAMNSSKEVALHAFNDSEGNFSSGNRYIFAFDFQGNLLANPVRPELIGQNRLNQTDRNGVAFVQDMTGLARWGSGSTYYIYPDPAENMTEKLKMSYVTKIDDSWWLGSGIYWSE